MLLAFTGIFTFLVRQLLLIALRWLITRNPFQAYHTHCLYRLMLIQNMLRLHSPVMVLQDARSQVSGVM